MKRNLAPVAVSNNREQIAAVAATLEHCFRNAGKFLADRIAVVGDGRAQYVEPDLLIEMAVIGRPFVALRIARVPEPATIPRPFDTAAGGRICNAGNDVGQTFAGRDLVDICSADLTAVLRQRHDDEAAVV